MPFYLFFGFPANGRITGLRYMRQVRDWLQFAPWGHCGGCGRVYKRKMTEVEVLAPQTMQLVTDACAGCSGKQQLPKPVLARTVPSVRQLSERQWRALTVLELSQGEPYQQPPGYKRRDKLSTLSWQRTSVVERVAELPAEEVAAALKYTTEKNATLPLTSGGPRSHVGSEPKPAVRRLRKLESPGSEIAYAMLLLLLIAEMGAFFRRKNRNGSGRVVPSKWPGPSFCLPKNSSVYIFI